MWRAGDNPAWAAPHLNESDWQPYTQWKLSPADGHIWVRCHADLSALRSMAHPAIQVSLFGAYRLFVNGEPLGGAGNLRSGNFSMNIVRSLPLPDSLPASLPATIAARITYRYVYTTILSPDEGVLEIRAGDEPVLDALRARMVLARSAGFLESALCYGVIGVLAVMLLGLFLYDRDRHELLLLSMACMALALIRVNEFCAAALAGYPVYISYIALRAGNVLLPLTEFPFFFAVARRRLPTPYRVLIGFVALTVAVNLVALALPAAQALQIDEFLWVRIRLLLTSLYLALATAPFVAFWPYAGIPRRIRPLAALCLLWGAADLIWLAVLALSGVPGLPNLLGAWGEVLAETRGYITALVVAALVALLFREQRQITQERAQLAGEMRSAQEVQRMLAPAQIDSAPGLKIDVAFHPVREVGGDFYQVLRRDGDATLIIVGDVSGKGLKPAMTGALAVGILRTLAAQGLGPAALLESLNRRMVEIGQEGFITCLCILVDAGGEAVAANAGHLPPYRAGEELAFAAGLPVGITADATYTQHSFSLAPGQTLTLLSDGVIEARNAKGELFGFERARAIATMPAEEMALAAQAFGQEDDITVLTLTRLESEEACAAAMAQPAII